MTPPGKSQSASTSTTALSDVIDRTASAVARRYGSWITYDDLAQEGWVWALSRPERIVIDDDGAVLEGAYDLVRHLTAVAKRERAARLGPVPQFSYERAVVEVVLPGLWDKDYRPPAPETVSRRSTDPAVASFNWEAFVADVRAAFEQLPARYRQVLFAYYGVAHDWRRAARYLGIGKTRANELGNEAVGRLVDILNGVPDVDVAGGHGVTGSRRVMSNAQARALTQQQWDGE
jgi:DNA-directed RNA polymerase specialized sigma24 family protein